ncbi:hypothetical protein QQZ08_000395 [Neonectria magnoliae]|uniref:Uncharacterized protein n=1 Tax=Neonectria magnoliae TaxID=2732573 RepID=A0ABR1IH64_9HYPO
METGGKKVYTEPNLGITENFNSAIADSNAGQLTEPRDLDLSKSVEKTWAVDELTLNV